MKKTLLLILLSPVIAFCFLFLSQVASARGFNHQKYTHHSYTPAPVVQTPPPVTPPPPVITPPTVTIVPPTLTSGLQWGFFQAPSGVTAPWTMEFTDGAFPSGSGNLVIFIEPPYNDAQIIAGQADSQLTSF